MTTAAAARRAPLTLTDEEADLSARTVDLFIRRVGGRQALIDTLAIADSAPEVEKIVNLLCDPRYSRLSLRTLCGYAGLTIADLFHAYRKAVLAKAHVEVAGIIATQLPPVVEDVMRQATPAPMPCPICRGEKAIARASGRGTVKCGRCQGKGTILSTPEVERQKLALELGQLVKSGGGGITVNQNQGVAVATAAPRHTGSLEQLQQAVGDILFSPSRRRASAPVVAVSTTTVDGDVSP